jgi:capsular polysaccharide biosynthesis protein
LVGSRRGSLGFGRHRKAIHLARKFAPVRTLLRVMISDVYRTLWRHKVLIIVTTLLLVAVTAILTSRQTKLYTASSLVRVQHNIQDSQEALGALMTGERLARTYEPVAETKSVRHLVETRLQDKLPDDTFVVDATQLSDLDLLKIAATHRDPKVAAAVANAIPAALTSFIDKTDTFPDTITMVERASPPTTPSSPNLRLRLVIALMLGLILSSGLVLFREMLSDRIEGPEELEKLTGHPVIATIPPLKLFPVPTVVSVKEPQERVDEIQARAAAKRAAGARDHG